MNEDPHRRQPEDPILVAERGLADIEVRIRYWRDLQSPATPYVIANLQWAGSQLANVVWHLRKARAVGAPQG